MYNQFLWLLYWLWKKIQTPNGLVSPYKDKYTDKINTQIKNIPGLYIFVLNARDAAVYVIKCWQQVLNTQI